jgi:pimeloyl-ACP methyl ester carboxylesterase
MSDVERDGPRPTHVVPFEGRDLAVDVAGDPDGYPVFLMHGMPGSRVGPRPRSIVLYRLGIRLISYDRPGYGQSDRMRGRSVFDAGADVAAIADYLGVDTFSVVGRSGGGPHALAAAAHSPERVERVALLVSAAPSDAEGLDWFEGMVESNLEAYSAADRQVAAESQISAKEAEEREVGALIDSLKARASEVSADPESMITQIGPGLASSDKRVIGNVGIKTLLTDTYTEAVGGEQGPTLSGGWVDDAIALRKSWGFKLNQVTCRVLLWHGMNDRFVPVGHTEWLADQLRSTRVDAESVEVRLAPGVAHFGAVEVLPEILGWLARPPALLESRR